MQKNFDLFISQLSETNATLDYFTDFEKVIRNTNKIAIKLNQLNYLIGKNDLRNAIKELYEENPKVFEVLDILLAVRTKDKKKTFSAEGKLVLLESYLTSLQGVIDFIEQSGLAEVLRIKILQVLSITFSEWKSVSIRMPEKIEAAKIWLRQ